MKSPGIVDGIVVALLISLGAIAVGLLFGGVIAYSTLFSTVVNVAALVYLIYLLRRSSARVGRVVVISAWLTLSLACWFFDIGPIEQVLLQAGLIWLVRSLYFHASLMAAALDFVLITAGIVASTWTTLNTGSLAGALWSFFLLQALFSWIPDPQRGRLLRIGRSRPDVSSFESAHRVALDAVRKLSQP